MSRRPALATDAAWRYREAPPSVGHHTRDAVAHAPGHDAGSVDQLIARVVGRLRGARTPLAEEQLWRMAEDVVLDAVRFTLGWAEAPVDEVVPVRRPSPATATGAPG